MNRKHLKWLAYAVSDLLSAFVCETNDTVWNQESFYVFVCTGWAIRSASVCDMYDALYYKQTCNYIYILDSSWADRNNAFWMPKLTARSVEQKDYFLKLFFISKHSAVYSKTKMWTVTPLVQICTVQCATKVFLIVWISWRSFQYACAERKAV